MKWFARLRERLSKEQYERGYECAAGALLEGRCVDEVESWIAVVDKSAFDCGLRDAIHAWERRRARGETIHVDKPIYQMSFIEVIRLLRDHGKNNNREAFVAVWKQLPLEYKDRVLRDLLYTAMDGDITEDNL